MDKKKTPPSWEKNPGEFIQNLVNDPVWLNTERKMKELREKFGLPDAPLPQDFPDYASWSAAWDADRDNFDLVTGSGARSRELRTLYWSKAFRAGIGTDGDFLRIGTRMNYEFGDCTLDDVVSEWKKQNSN